MSWFSDVTDFLSSPGFRIGSGVVGLAAGAGAFEDMGGFGEALTYGAGAANLASGAATTFREGASSFDQITGSLQMGLGGYNLLQQETTLPSFLGGGTVGGFGSFGTVFDRLTNPGDYEPFAMYRGAPDAELGMSSGQRTSWQGSFNPDDPMGAGPAPNGTAPPASLDSFDPGAPYSDGSVSPDDPARAIEARYDAANPARPPMRIAPVGRLQMAGTPMPGVSPGASPDAFFNPDSAAVRAGRFLPTEATMAAAASSRGIGGFIDRLVNYAATNPMQAAMGALQIGGMLSQLFARSSGDIAAEAMAQMSATGADGTEFRRLYEERAKREIDKRSEELRGQLTARFSSRGMLKSTVYSTALIQLEQSRTELMANLPYNSLQAWNQVAAGMGNNMRSAAALGQASAPRVDFSNMSRVLAQSNLTQNMAR